MATAVSVAELRAGALLLVLLLLADAGAALRCWSCGADTVPECSDPFAPRDLQGPSPCKGPPPAHAPRDARPACAKATVALNEAETYVYRWCEWVSASGGGGEDYCSHAERALPAHARVLSCSTCFSDACNTAAPAPAPATALLVPLLLLGPLLLPR